MKEELLKLLKVYFSEETSAVIIKHYSDSTVYYTLFYEEGIVYRLPEINGIYEFCVCFGGGKYYYKKNNNSLESVFEAIVDAYLDNIGDFKC